MCKIRMFKEYATKKWEIQSKFQFDSKPVLL